MRLPDIFPSKWLDILSETKSGEQALEILYDSKSEHIGEIMVSFAKAGFFS